MDAMAVIEGTFQNLLSHFSIVKILFLSMKDLKESVFFDLEIFEGSECSVSIGLVNESPTLAQRSCFMIYWGGITA